MRCAPAIRPCVLPWPRLPQKVSGLLRQIHKQDLGVSMKRVITVIALCLGAPAAFADAAGGNNCGWGQLLFEGQSGVAAHVLAITTNGSTGNNTFGVTSGTNGCSGSGTISYGGKEMVNVAPMMDEFSEDMAQGDGEVITAVAVSLGIAPEDRTLFKQRMRDNFDAIFPSQDVTLEQVLAAMWVVMENDEVLRQYI